ncbi:MAG TPA: hypothetical protein VM618_10010, partial [Acidimicrobiia bacterium]|nr:hypothetical protein [Acidimicrobiia bacterium]
MIVFWSPKGGSGTSVVAAAVAIRLARAGGARLVDLAGDLPALLGLAREPEHGVADWLTARSAPSDDALRRLTVEAAPGLALVPAGSTAAFGDAAPSAARRLVSALSAGAPTVVDAGTAKATAVREIVEAATEGAGEAVVVIRSCYLALRRAVASDLTSGCAGIALVEEQNRSLTPSDVSQILELPLL